ncbi:hypothetical protein DERF_009989, partial [Dermatophagoides farinae]
SCPLMILEMVFSSFGPPTSGKYLVEHVQKSGNPFFHHVSLWSSSCDIHNASLSLALNSPGTNDSPDHVHEPPRILYPMMMIKGADGRIEKRTAEEFCRLCKSKVTGYHHTTDAQQDHHRLPDYTHQGYDADDAML